MRYILTMMLFAVSSIAWGQYKHGHIVDQYGKAYPGWLNYKSSDKVGYKELKNSKAEILGIDQVRAFSIEADSFVTVHYVDLVSEFKIDAFAKVLLKGPDKILCESAYYEYGRWVNGTRAIMKVRVYLIKEVKAIFPLTEYNFYFEMPKLIRDNEMLCKKIVSKKLSFDNLKDIINEYELQRKNQK
jgi:hypothetical protein